MGAFILQQLQSLDTESVNAGLMDPHYSNQQIHKKPQQFHSVQLTFSGVTKQKNLFK